LKFTPNSDHGQSAATKYRDRDLTSSAMEDEAEKLSSGPDGNSPPASAPAVSGAATASLPPDTQSPNSPSTTASGQHPSQTPTQAAVGGSKAPASQPMTATQSASSSASSAVLAKDASSKEKEGGPSPYGTRSRNRRETAPRPNYAEDKDNEMEYEFTSPALTNGKQSKSTTSNDVPAPTAAAEPGRISGVSTRRASAVATMPTAAPPTAAKDTIPGTSTFSSNPFQNGTATNPKKRKAASSTTESKPVSQNGTSHQQLTRKASIAAHTARGFSNMMSFDNCGAQLHNGELIADDGTVLAVNGMFAFRSCSRVSNSPAIPHRTSDFSVLSTF
jgi:hypothetical protein